MIMAGKQEQLPVYIEQNESLGGAYFTTRIGLATMYANGASREHNSPPLILEIKPIFDLYPDEDWVVDGFNLSSDGLGWDDPRYDGFFYALFDLGRDEGYDMDDTSLSDIYKLDYHYLNDEYNITWKDSLRITHSVRQEEPLYKNQIIRVHQISSD